MNRVNIPKWGAPDLCPGLPFFHSHILFTLYAGNTRRSRAAACSRACRVGIV